MTTNMKWIDAPSSSPRKPSGLLGRIEALQGELPWESILDAGTETHSLGWIISLKTERWTAVTGAKRHAA